MQKEKLITKDETAPYRSERIVLSKGEEVGWHVSHQREEVIFVTKGKATFMDDEKKILLKAGDSHSVDEDIRHNIMNEQEEDLEYIYVVKLS